MDSESPGPLVKMQISDWEGLGGVDISNQLPGDADAARD
jgi:hypothetical protein